MSTRVWRQLPFAMLGTLLVVAAPAVIAAVLPGGPLVAIPACVALSVTASLLLGALWRRLPASRDILFSDLMLWGWLRRLRTELRLERVETLVIFRGGPVEAIRDVRALLRVTAMLESRDPYTRRHSHRVTRHSEGIARELGLAPEEIAFVRTAAALHDIGKFFTPREVLNKPDGLTDEEFAIIKRHPGDGAELVAGVVDPKVERMIRHHHERLGGTGYPDRLAGDAIPLGARIIAVADTFDAMTSTRAYRTARPHQRALRVLREEAGVALDAGAVGAFLAYYSGRRSARWSSLVSSLPHALSPLRELLLAGGRTLPTLGASAAVLAAPAISAGMAATPRPVPATVARHDSRPARVTRRHAAAVVRSAKDPRTRVTRQRARAGVPSTRPDAPFRPGAHRPAGGEGRPAASATDPEASVTPNGTDAPAPTLTDAPTATDAPPEATASPIASPSPAPTAGTDPTPPPDVDVPPVTVTAGNTTVQIPPVHVDLPDLPVHLPPIKLP